MTSGPGARARADGRESGQYPNDSDDAKSVAGVDQFLCTMVFHRPASRPIWRQCPAAHQLRFAVTTDAVGGGSAFGAGEGIGNR